MTPLAAYGTPAQQAVALALTRAKRPYRFDPFTGEFAVPPDLRIRVRGTLADRGAEVLTKAQAAGAGLTLVFIDAARLGSDAAGVVARALTYRE